MSRYKLLMAAALVVFAIGAAGLYGLLDGLQNGREFHYAAIIAVIIYMLFHPLLNRAVDKYGPASWGAMTEERVEEIVGKMDELAQASLREQVAAGKKVAAIRLMREKSGAALRDAKCAVEWMMARRTP